MLDILHAFGENVWLYGGAFLLVLTVLVFIHELGHFLLARLFGVRVEVFSVGFGPEIFGFEDSHGTRWKFSLIPLGGYVKLFGYDETDEGGQAVPENRRGEALFAKPLWQRSLIVFAGPAINYLYAVLVMAFVFAFHGQALTPPYVSAVVGGSAAERAGFLPHDKVLAIDGVSVRSFEDIRRSVMVGLDARRVFKVERAGRSVDLVADPDFKKEEDRYGFASSRGVLGVTGAEHAVAFDKITAIDGVAVGSSDDIRARLLAMINRTTPFWISVGDTTRYLVAPSQALNAPVQQGGKDYLVFSHAYERDIVKMKLGDAVSQSISEVWGSTTTTLHALGQMVTGARSTDELGGLIRIGAMAGDVAQRGWLALLMFSALLSINLGLINLFPIPVLDGGRLVFYAIEAVIGRPVSEKAQDYAFRFGFILVIALMAYTNINDVVQLFS